MTRRRWIADQVSENRAVLSGSHAQHLSRVLRARIGQEFDISTGEKVRRGRITSILPDRIEFELGEAVDFSTSLQAVVALSIFKFSRMEWAIEKCTELGVWRILPVIAQRTESHLAKAALKRVERWRRIAREAAEQSRQVSTPEIMEPVKSKEVIASPGDTRIVLSEVEERTSLREALKSHSNEVTLAFGPEGGWTDAELEQFRRAGWTSASLGRNVLRAETAAIAALAIVLSEEQ
jgi:16S rRNA (uracil1498-N3)-methyltransferase